MYGQNDCEYDYYGTGMGIAPLAVAVPAVSGIVKTISGLFGGTRKQRDANRKAENSALYDAAIAGDAAALEKLRRNSTGMATQVGKDDAKQKYAAALKILGSQPAPQPGAYPPQVAQASLFGGMGTPLLIGGAVLGVILLTQSKRR